MDALPAIPTMRMNEYDSMLRSNVAFVEMIKSRAKKGGTVGNIFESVAVGSYRISYYNLTIT